MERKTYIYIVHDVTEYTVNKPYTGNISIFS